MKFIISIWSINAMLKEICNSVMIDKIKVEILGDWDNWRNAYNMEQKVKND